MPKISTDVRKSLIRGYRKRISEKTSKSKSMVDKVFAGTHYNQEIYLAILDEIKAAKSEKEKVRAKEQAIFLSM